MHCSFCSRFLPDWWTEDLYEGILLCKTCIEDVARKMIEEGRAHLVHKDLRDELEKNHGEQKR